MSAAGDQTYDLDLLGRSRAKWESSPGLRAVYGDLARRLAAHRPPGPALEIGSGIGWLATCWDDLLLTDVAPTPWVPRTASAYALEETGGPWSAIVGIDVLHHLVDPFRFFASAARTLRPGGRILLAEPAATPFGRVFYGLCHHEPMRPSALRPPFVLPPDNDRGEFANMAMASALFVHHADWTRDRLAALGLRLAALEPFALAAYPLTGGFSKPQVLPTRALEAFLAVEARLPAAFLRLVGLRWLVALERTDSPVRP